MNRKKIVLPLALLLCCAVLSPMPLSAQQPASLEVYGQTHVKLPWGVDNLILLDGSLYAYSDGLMLRGVPVAMPAVANGPSLPTSLPVQGVIANLAPDTVLHRIHAAISYGVRNPHDSLLYFTAPKGKETRLFVHHGGKGRRSNQAVAIEDWKGEVLHPVFSPNGRYMVFSSSSYTGKGGYDLWCSHYDGKKWQKPFNLGTLVNTHANEVSPVFYDRYLIFASNGMMPSDSSYSLYATGFPQDKEPDDMLFHPYIVQRLPEPLNSASDDRELSFDAHQSIGYWLSRRDGREVLYRYRGRLDGVLYRGQVTDAAGLPLPDAEIRALCKGRVEMTATTDGNGCYTLFLQPDITYMVHALHGGCYTYISALPAAIHDADRLIAEVRYDMRLQSLPLDEPIAFKHIFGIGADIDMTDEGEISLQPVALFLQEHGDLRAEVTLYSNASTDTSFNMMLNELRLNVLRDFFNLHTSNSGRIVFFNGNNSAIRDTVKEGEHRLEIIFRDDINR